MTHYPWRESHGDEDDGPINPIDPDHYDDTVTNNARRKSYATKEFEAYAARCKEEHERDESNIKAHG